MKSTFHPNGGSLEKRMAEWAINGRFRGQVQTGVQRVAAAYLARIGSSHVVVEPDEPLSGLRGHWWEQATLPRVGGDRPLWSPCNTGPLSVSCQVVTIHDASVFDHPEWFSRGFAAFYRMLLPKLARRCRKVVTVSEFSRQRLMKYLGVPGESVVAIWNGIDERFSPVDTTATAVARKAIGLQDEPYFLSLSTLEPRKNLKLVLQSFEQARPYLPKNCKLVIVGKKGSAQVFRDDGGIGTAASDVLMTGFIADGTLVGLLSGALAVLYPSLYEGFGLPVVEAMACGVPAVTTVLTSLPEVAGNAAIYVDPADPADLARQLVRLADSEAYRAEYAGRGRARATLFSWDRAARQMDDILAAAA